MAQKSKTRKVSSNGHSYTITTIHNVHSGKPFYTVRREDARIPKIFDSKRDIERNYPNLKGLL